jgi:glutathione S-transferase
MKPLILHNFRRCPFCIRVRIVLALKKIPYEVVEERLRDWTDWMIDNVPAPRVPILRIGNKIIRESNAINFFLNKNFDQDIDLIPDNNSKYTEMESWMDWCDMKLKSQIDLFKYGENRVFDSVKHPAYEQKLRELLHQLEDTLVSRPNLLGADLSLADVAIIPFIRQIMRTRSGEFDWGDFLQTKFWANNILETEWFQEEVMRKWLYAKEKNREG